jgi:hypothetical protein
LHSESIQITIFTSERAICYVFFWAARETIFFSKPYDWNTENEVRVLVPLADCDFDPVNRRHLFKISVRHISRIILGWRMAQEAITKVVGTVGSLRPEVEVWQGQIIKGRFALGEKLHGCCLP